jgi:uridine phosphorylase
VQPELQGGTIVAGRRKPMGGEPYITPEHIVDSRYCGRYDFGIICFRGYRSSALIVETLAAEKVEEGILYCTRPENILPAVYEKEINGNRMIIITGVAFGGPQTAIYVEELRYLGVKAIIGVSIAAGISPKFARGEFFYIDEVVCLDGVSTTYYGDGERISTSSLQGEVLSIANELGIELQAATGASVDAIYHETPEIIQNLKELNVDVMNLDIAPFITTARFRGIEAVMFGYVSDCFERDEWASWMWDKSAANKTTADLLSRLIEVVTADVA